MDTLRDLHGFSLFLADHVAAGESALPEELIALWRAEHPLPAELTKSIEALELSLDDLNAGRTEDFNAVNAAIRRAHSWSVGQ